MCDGVASTAVMTREWWLGLSRAMTGSFVVGVQCNFTKYVLPERSDSLEPS